MTLVLVVVVKNTKNVVGSREKNARYLWRKIKIKYNKRYDKRTSGVSLT
ncbi:hypothetical protein TICRE_22260 [Tissierella creatinophila DSM 6911]|uniref:Uncharacterized protein n=1 Tax=Tissierella creatinophila DSM 6911 TaxID=1123403 RepID=A0A1U7M3Q7_TISCR|nr:hypothetical protein TICRE_22260 [Tissierella creatinophila DSM 6911]